MVTSRRLKGRTTEAAAVPRRSALAVWIHFIIAKAEIHREHKHPKQGKKRNHRSISSAFIRGR